MHKSKCLWKLLINLLFIVVACQERVHRTHLLTQRNLPTYVESEKLMSPFQSLLHYHLFPLLFPCFSLLVLRNSLPREHISLQYFSGRIAPVCSFCVVLFFGRPKWKIPVNGCIWSGCLHYLVSIYVVCCVLSAAVNQISLVGQRRCELNTQCLSLCDVQKSIL